MKKATKVTFLIIGIALSGFLVWAWLFSGWFFSSGGRYDDHLLEMGVPFESPADIHAWNEGYSGSTACPWGFVHKGMDLFFNNSAKVLAMAPGQVSEITFVEDPSNPANMFFVKVSIQFNNSMFLRYNFEPWTSSRSDAEVQLGMIKVKVGDWVTKGSVIANFLSYHPSAHIDFSVDNTWDHTGRVCPQPHFSAAAYGEMMNLIHTYHAEWEMCYA